MTKNLANLPALPALPSAARARRLHACDCGCGGTTASTFVPGHDSVLKAWVVRVERGVVELSEAGIPHAGLRKRVQEVVEARAAGTNVTFMRNVPLPEPVAVEKVG